MNARSIADVAAASRPGSLEARQIHGCTCVRTDGRVRTWDPEHVEDWLDTVSLDCPAHGLLLGKLIAARDASGWAVVRGMRKLVRDERDYFMSGFPLDPAQRTKQPRVTVPAVRPLRSLRERLADAAWSGWYGFLEGWRDQ